MIKKTKKKINTKLNKNIDGKNIKNKLVVYRKKIDVVDSKISKLLSDRYKLVKSIGEYKIDNKLPITNLNREKQVINNVVKKYKNNNIKKYINNIYLNIIRISKSIESYWGNYDRG